MADHIGGSFDLIVLKVNMGTFSTIVAKWNNSFLVSDCM